MKDRTEKTNTDVLRNMCCIGGWLLHFQQLFSKKKQNILHFVVNVLLGTLVSPKVFLGDTGVILRT